MNGHRDAAALLDVYRAGRLALEFGLEARDRDAFAADLKTQPAVLHQLLVMGEAVKRLSDAFCQQHSEIPWRQMAGLRDVLIHSYDEIDVDVVWQLLAEDLPALLNRLRPLLPNAQ